MTWMIGIDTGGTFTDVMAHRGSLDDRRLARAERREQLGRLVAEIPVGWKP